MPPKRKAAVATTTAPRRTLRDSFKAVSKAAAISLPGKAEKSTKNAGKPATVLVPSTNAATSTTTTTTRSSRRKVATVIEDGDEDVILLSLVAPAKKENVKVEEVKKETKTEIKKEIKKEFKKEEKPKPAPSRKRRRGATPDAESGPSVLDALFSGAKRVKASAATNTTTIPELPSSSPVPTGLITPPASFAESVEPEEVDPEYSALPRLHRALLTSLNLHYSGSNVAPLFSNISHSIENLARIPLTQSSLLRIAYISPYIYLTASPLRIHLSQPAPSVEAQCTTFDSTLLKYTTFTAIPEAPVTATVDKSAAVRRRGKGLLAEMKASATKDKKVQQTLQQFGMKPVAKVRANSLLERIKAKQAEAKAEPTPAEKAKELARARVPEVLEVLRGLRGKGESKALREVVDIVKGSVRMPISKEEAEEAVRLAADEKVGWVEVREAGGVAAVMFKKDAASRFA